MAYELAVFDMAGTTVRDPGLVAQALVLALAEQGCVVDPASARPLMGYEKPEAIRRLLRGAGHTAIAADTAKVDAIHTAFVAHMLRCYRESREVAAINGAEALFATLRARGVRVALNTAFSREIAEAIVARLGWRERGLIDDLVATDDVAEGRPAPHMIRLLMQRANVTDAACVIKVGDTEVDVREGRNAGCGLVVSVTSGAFTRSELEPYRPDQIIDALDELPALLGDAVAASAA